MTTQTATIVQEAMAFIKQGRADTAVARLSLLSAATHTETTLRTLAVAHAQTGNLELAAKTVLQAIECAKGAAEATTIALAARIAEDRNEWFAASDAYLQLVAARPNQHAFWRSMWRCVLHTNDAMRLARAFSLSNNLGFEIADDSALAIAVLRELRRHIQTRDEAQALLRLAEKTHDRHPSSSAARWLWVSLTIDSLPIAALRRIEADTARAAESTAMVDADSVSAALKLPSLYGDASSVHAWRERYGQALVQLSRRIEAHASPSLVKFTAFGLAYHGMNDLALQSMRGDLLSRLVAPFAPTRANEVSRTTKNKIRVGFLSKHIRDCTVGHYFKRFFGGLESAQIEVHLFACGSVDTLTDEVASGVSACHRIALIGDSNNDDAVLKRVAAQVAQAALDVLIYPEIGMEPLIEKLAAMRLAPLQCALWGHPDTTGLPTIDVFFSAAEMEPEAASQHYREALQLLPGLGCSYPRPPKAEPTTRASLGLPQDAPLLVCAQASFKWSARFIDAIAALLLRTPSAKLVYFRNRDPIAAFTFDDFLRDKLTSHGVDAAERTISLAETTRARFLAVLKACDLSLDTFDFSGGNTTLDALSVGLPVVTLPGEFMRGRQSLAMLNIIELPQLIAKDVDDYVQIAGGLVCDRAALSSLRSHIENRAHQLFDDERPIHALAQWIVLHGRIN
jgi:predicted O-linked N-acetylglucosamine transferase (SPINDLY family)